MHQHEEDIFKMIIRKLYPPTRKVRYCCEVLKEHGGEGRFCVTGVRWDESKSRSSRNVIDFNAYGSKSTKCNRIREFKRWPKFKENFIRCFDRLLIKRAEIGKQDTWKSGEEVFEWRLNG